MPQRFGAANTAHVLEHTMATVQRSTMATRDSMATESKRMPPMTSARILLVALVKHPQRFFVPLCRVE